MIIIGMMIKAKKTAHNRSVYDIWAELVGNINVKPMDIMNVLCYFIKGFRNLFYGGI
jgi:hypothetical protein